MSDVFKLRVLEAGEVFYDGECTSLVLPVLDGKFGIMAHHLNTIGSVIPGEMSFRDAEGNQQVAAVSNGMFKVEDNEVLVLVESAERPEEIDANRARRAEAAAKETLLLQRSVQEYNDAYTKLARALSRLQVYDRYASHRGKQK